MGAPKGNKNAAGPHRKRGMRTIRRDWSTGTTIHTFKIPKNKYYGKRVGTPATGYHYRTPADWYRY